MMHLTQTLKKYILCCNYPTTFNVAPLLILYRVDSFSITMHPSDGLPEHEPPCIKNPLRPHIEFVDAGYNS